LCKGNPYSPVSQEELSFGCELDRLFIGFLEKEKQSPFMKSAKKLADYLKVKVSTMMKEIKDILNN
jgi:DNA-binding XRE family transcriptional regulator